MSLPALLVVDAQRAFDAWDAAAGRNNPGALAAIAALLAGFRAAGAPVLHIRHRNPRTAFAPGGPGFAPYAEARERPGEAVLEKTVNSAFIGTGLEERLRAAGIRRLVVCGATTNHCVETTTRMAGNLGFDAWLAEDACWTYDRAGPDGRVFPAADVHAMTLANLHGEFARVVGAGDALRSLAGGAPRA